jgi:RHS repeat-associated protein
MSNLSHLRSAHVSGRVLTVLTVLTAAGCGGGVTRGSAEQAVRATTRIAYYHAAISAGPSLITRDDGSLLDERRAEPFGAAIDSITGPVDFDRDPHNSLNKETDVTTGWSDHGARWLAPDTARWLTPDPPLKSPDPAFMTEPWGLHPYQYVKQNPIVFWDPDGRDDAPIFVLDCRSRCDENGLVHVSVPAAQSKPSTARRVVESAVAPVVTIASNKWTLIARAGTVSRLADGTKTVARFLPEAEKVAKPLRAVDGVLSAFFGATHAVQYHLADTQEEKEEHAGGAALNALSLTPLALPIALWGLFDSKMNARVGHAMQVASDAIAQPIDVEQMYRELRHMQRMEAARENARNKALPAATDWHDTSWQQQLPTRKLDGPR